MKVRPAVRIDSGSVGRFNNAESEGVRPGYKTGEDFNSEGDRDIFLKSGLSGGKAAQTVRVRIPTQSNVHQSLSQRDQRDQKSFGGERIGQPEEGSRCDRGV